MAAELLTDLSRATDSNSSPLSGAKFYFYATGTTTPQSVYTTSALNVAHANPVVADSSGLFAPIYFDATKQYRGILKDAAGTTIQDIDPINSGVISQLGASSGSAAIGFLQSGTGTVARTVAGKLGEFFTATDLSGVAADGTDQTANLIAGITAHVGDTDRKTIIIPPGMVWHPQEVFADAGVAAKERLNILDLSGMSAARTSGENTKLFGVFGVDPDATEETMWGVISGHHPVFLLNNMNTSDTTSAENGLMSLMFARGYWSDSTEDNRSFRGAMIAQYRRSVLDTTQWEFVLRSLAPWEALADGVDYTRWAANTARSVGDYAVTGDGNIYKCTVAGTTGASKPTHTSGTATDGSVTWQWVDTNDKLVFGIDQQGRIKTNGASTATDLAAFKQAVTDSASIAVMRLSGTGASKAVYLIAEPTNSSGTIVAAPGFRWLTTGVLEFRDGGGSLIASMEGAGKGFKIEAQRNGWAQATDGDATPSVANITTLYVANTTATSITGLDDGQDGQTVEIIATTGNTTLVHSATFRLSGSTDQVLTAFSTVTFRKVPASITDAWFEVARSIK